jgi:hypothetical protein
VAGSSLARTARRQLRAAVRPLPAGGKANPISRRDPGQLYRLRAVRPQSVECNATDYGRSGCLATLFQPAGKSYVNAWFGAFKLIFAW